jgi:cholesterol transport system auxiliary component
MNRALVIAVLSLLLTGCFSFGEKSSTPAVVYYVLSDPALKDANPLRAQARGESHAPAAESGPPRADAPTLLVLDTTTSGFYNTDHLVFARSAETRGQYQFARWTERPGKRFGDLMRARLDRVGAYHVATPGGYVRGDLLLDTELVEFYHDASSEPGRMRLVLRADLVDLKQRTLLGRRVFEQEVALTSFDAAGAAQAANLAASQALDELTAWLATPELAPTIKQ